jgi:rsbT antagonist protein RsbS
MGRTIPIIRLYETLIVSIQIELSDAVVLELRDDICAEIMKHEARGLIIEASGIDVFDSFIARTVRDIAKVASLMGVRTVLAGLDAAMAITLVEMGMHMDGVRTALNLEAAMESLRGGHPSLPGAAPSGAGA